MNERLRRFGPRESRRWSSRSAVSASADYAWARWMEDFHRLGEGFWRENAHETLAQS